MTERLMFPVTYDPAYGYVTTDADELRLSALSLAGFASAARSRLCRCRDHPEPGQARAQRARCSPSGQVRRRGAVAAVIIFSWTCSKHGKGGELPLNPRPRTDV